MPNIQQALSGPTPGADLTRTQAFLDFLAQHLPAADYEEAVALLWAAVDPVYAARRNAA